MRIVVTGATGNVATALLRRLSTEPGIELVGVCRRPPRSPQPPHDQVRWLACDLGYAASVEPLTDAMRGADTIVHTAWALQPTHDQGSLRRTNVDGARHVCAAARAAGVPHLVNISSVGVYSRGEKDREVDETWPNDGIATSSYSRHKAEVERLFDAAGLPALTHVRPGLVFQRDAGSEIARLFAGPLVPTRLLRRVPLPLVPLPASIIAQVVHADDLAQALVQILLRRATGAFNIATEPWLTPRVISAALGGRWVSIPDAALRAVVAAGWRARLLPIDEGWIDLGYGAPLMDTRRARRELGWVPQRDTATTLREMLDGMRDGAGAATPELRPRDGLSRRISSALSGRLPGSSRYP